MDFIMNYKATNITGGHHPVEVLILEPLFWVIFHGPLEAVCLLPISGQRLSWSHDMLHVLSPSIEPMCRNDIWQSSWAAGAERVWDWLLHFLLLLEIWLQLARERVLVVISDSPISSAKSSFDLWISLVFRLSGVMAPTNALKPSGAWKNQPSVPSGDANAGSIAHLKEGIGKIDFQTSKMPVRVACCLKPYVELWYVWQHLRKGHPPGCRTCPVGVNLPNSLDWLNSTAQEIAILDGSNHAVR